MRMRRRRIWMNRVSVAALAVARAAFRRPENRMKVGGLDSRVRFYRLEHGRWPKPRWRIWTTFADSGHSLNATLLWILCRLPILLRLMRHYLTRNQRKC